MPNLVTGFADGWLPLKLAYIGSLELSRFVAIEA